MSGAAQQVLSFLRLPDLKQLLLVGLSLQGEDEEPRSQQIKMCRDLVLLYPDILASPALDSFTDIRVIMAVSFYQRGILQGFAQRHHLQMGSPQRVLPGVLQCCLSYSLITRLAPSWNKAGLYLISGKDFLTEKGRMNAVSLELNVTEGELCISTEACAVRMPPTTLQDLDLAPLVLNRFHSDPDFTLDLSSAGASIWCHVLPSMKKGQIISISHQLPRDAPFRTYKDLQTHWNCLYGYRLPEVTDEEVVYCSIHFRLLGNRLFTYPLNCIRLQPLRRCPGVDLEGALGSFMSDIGTRLRSVCGFPARMSSRACHHTASVSAAATAQEPGAEWVNLTASSIPTGVFTHRPALPPHSLFGSQPASWILLSQQDRAPGLTQTQRAGEDETWPSSSSSSSLWVPYDSTCQTTPSLSSSSISSPPLPPLSQPAVNPAPRLVPVFKSKRPSRHISVALPQQRPGRNVERSEKVIVPTAVKNKSTKAPLGSSPALLPVPPPSIVPRFEANTQLSRIPQTASQLKPIFSFGPVSKRIQVKATSDSKSNSCCRPAALPPGAPQLPPSSVVANKDHPCSNREGAKGKKSRALMGDVDVEKVSRGSQLSQLKAAALLAWLRARGVSVSAKCKKEELIRKVMACLAEA